MFWDSDTYSLIEGTDEQYDLYFAGAAAAGKPVFSKAKWMSDYLCEIPAAVCVFDDKLFGTRPFATKTPADLRDMLCLVRDEAVRREAETMSSIELLESFHGYQCELRAITPLGGAVYEAVGLTGNAHRPSGSPREFFKLIVRSPALAQCECIRLGEFPGQPLFENIEIGRVNTRDDWKKIFMQESLNPDALSWDEWVKTSLREVVPLCPWPDWDDLIDWVNLKEKR